MRERVLHHAEEMAQATKDAAINKRKEATVPDSSTKRCFVVTLSRVLRGERILDELNVVPKLFNRRLG